MPQAQAILTNFTAGELSPRLLGRTDLSKYANGLKIQLNFITQKHGGIIRRSGSRFVAETKDSAALIDRKARMLPFQFSTQQTYVFEFGELYVRFYRDKARLQHGAIETVTGAVHGAGVATITLGSHSVGVGDEISVQGIVNAGLPPNGFNGTFTVTTITATTISYALATAPAGAYVSDGTVTPTTGVIATEIVTPYAAADLSKLKITQSADVLYIAHPDHEPRLLQRTAGADADPAIWNLVEFNPQNGPYLAINVDATATITLGAEAGGVRTLTATAAAVALINAGDGFKSTDVGRTVTWSIGGTVWDWGTITNFTSASVVDVTIGSDVSTGGTTDQWAVGAWSDTNGWPFSVVFHEDRLVWGGTPLEPQTLFFSSVGDFPNYTPFNPTNGQVRPTDAIKVTINDDRVNTIHWLRSGHRGLGVLTNGGVFLAESTAEETITSANINVLRHITESVSELAEPQQVSGVTLIPASGDRKVFEFVFRFDLDRFVAPDLTILAEHITLGGLIETAFSSDPDNVFWGLLADGSIAAMTYERQEEVVGWHRHIIGGTIAGETQARVESISVIRDGSDDLLWMIVRRTINGVTRRYIEFVEPLFADDATGEEARFGDSALTLDNGKAITGATADNPVVITAVAHGFATGDRIRIRSVKGMEAIDPDDNDLNDITYLAKVLTADTFEITDLSGIGIDGSKFTVYVSGGFAYLEVEEVSGLDHLVGETVKILMDGATHPDKVVSSGGKVTLDRFGSLIVVGLAYTTRAITLPLIPVLPGETRGKTKRADHAVLRLNRSLGGRVGDTSIDDLVTRKPSDKMNVATPLFTGMIRQAISARHGLEPTVTIETDDPLPMNLLSMEVEMGVEGI